MELDGYHCADYSISGVDYSYEEVRKRGKGSFEEFCGLDACLLSVL